MMPLKRMLLSAALLATGWSAWLPARADEPKRGGELVYAYPSGPRTLDPYMINNTVEIEVVNQIFESLVALGEDYTAKPALAAKVDVSPDARTFTFTLRQGVHFHNGKVMTSADVLASFERYRAVSPNADALADVARFDAPDPDTFVIQLNHTNAVFLDVLKTPSYPFAIMPAEEKDKPAGGADVIGTGPFSLGEWVKGSYLTLKRFDGYTPDPEAKALDGYAGRKTVYLDDVRYNIVPEPNARMAAVQSGGADVASQIPLSLSQRVAGEAGYAVQQVFPGCQQVFFQQTKFPPTDNPLIRRAVQAAMGVDDIMDALGQVSKRNAQLSYPGTPYFIAGDPDFHYDMHDLAKAKALLQEAGYHGQTLVLQTTPTYSWHLNATLVLSEQLKAAGFKVQVAPVDWNTNSNDRMSGGGGWNISLTNFCSQPLLGPQQWRPFVMTIPQVQDDKVLLDAYGRLNSALALADRQQAWADIEHRVFDQAYFLKVGDYGTVNVLRSSVHDLAPWYNIRFWGAWKQ